jgi:hypothetical protein
MKDKNLIRYKKTLESSSLYLKNTFFSRSFFLRFCICIIYYLRRKQDRQNVTQHITRLDREFIDFNQFLRSLLGD